MADIRNDQYLHRPGAGRGAVTPDDPLEVLLHSGGQPISGTNRLPVEATLSGRLVQIIKEYKDVPYDQGDGLTGTYGTLHFGENMHAEGGYTRFLDVAAYPHLDVLLYNDTDVDLLAGVRIFPVPGISERDYYGRYIFRNEVISNREV